GVEYIQMPLTSVLVTNVLGLSKEGAAEEDEDGGESTITLNGTKLLVVDDIEINLIISEESLLVYGGIVDTADSGEKAIEMIIENDYDIVFMDHMMPEMDGVDVTKIVRSLPGEKYAKLPIVALTANVVGDVREMFLESGMSDFLSKPLEHSEIERVLKEWLPAEKWNGVRSGEPSPESEQNGRKPI
ncbi:MAG: response regulator, partial [Defluviitaleaceae bacterium]|nr:response regulator [Defluviitaleaceae bacterium]